MTMKPWAVEMCLEMFESIWILTTNQESNEEIEKKGEVQGTGIF